MSLIPPSAPGVAQRDLKPRLFWATGIVGLAFLVLVGRLYQLQILQGDEYKERADENFVKEIRVPADRGLMMDRNRRVLVDSRPSYDVFLTPYFCGKTCGEVLERISGLLGLPPEDVARAQETLKSARKLERFRPFAVAVDIPRDRLDVVLAHQMDLAGVDVQPTPHRHYRYAGLGGHLIGYMNEVGPEELKKLNDSLLKEESAQGQYYLGDYVGRRGLERRYERELRGIDGKLRVAVDAKGRAKEESEIIPEDQREVPSIPGNNLVLSIDWRLQELAEKTFPAAAGVVLAMEAKTGFLLALVDRPAPDPNRMSGRISSAELKAIYADPLKPELFRSIQAHYQPGSTFKAVTSIAALEEGHYHPGTTVHCPGYFRLGSHRWRCDKDSGHGPVDFNHALGASCNVFFYNVAPMLGADGVAKWARLLGFGKPTGFDIAGEISGVIPDEAWHDKYLKGGYQKGMAVNVAIGQGDVNVTPMQQLVFYGALASGVVWRPQVVKRIEDPNGNVLKEFAPEERGRLNVKKSTRETVLKGLFAAVNEKYGTGYWQRVKEFNVAGKTGTAQVVKLGARRLKAEQITYFHRDHAWFAAFAPAEDPEIVVVVLNEHSGFGSSNAAPTAMALMREYMRLKAEDAAGGAPVAVAGAVPSAAAPPPPAVKPIAPSVKPPAAAVTAAPVPAKADAAAEPIAVPPARRPAVPVPAVAGPSPAAPASAGAEQALPRVKVPAVPAPVSAPARADEPADPSPPKPPELRIPDALPLPSNEAAPPGAPETPAAGRRAVRGGARGA
jgi:penicillin-binding protein 2